MTTCQVELYVKRDENELVSWYYEHNKHNGWEETKAVLFKSVLPQIQDGTFGIEGYRNFVAQGYTILSEGEFLEE